MVADQIYQSMSCHGDEDVACMMGMFIDRAWRGNQNEMRKFRMHGIKE